MELFKNYKIIQNEENTEIILYVSTLEEEFGEEFLAKVNDKITEFEESAQAYLKEKLPSVKKATVKVMVGGILVSSFSMLGTGGQQASVSASAAGFDYNMSYVFAGNTSSYINQVNQTQGNLQAIAPDYFEINANGSLKVTSKFDKNFVNEMNKKNIKTIPYLTNNWDRVLGRQALENREQLSTQVANFINANNLSGVNVDIENVTHEDRAAYTDFVRLLRQKLGPNKEISVAVSANPYNWQTGWHGSYDYKALSDYADYLMIMAYDEHYHGGEAGPVASVKWVEKSVQYAINKDVPVNKIVLGMPLFGRYWKEGASVSGSGIPSKTVDIMVAKYKGKVVYDVIAQAPKATVTIPAGDPGFVVNGKTLGPGTYTIWYENTTSIKAKVDLVHKYNLKGTGSWALGNENVSLWSSFTAWRTGDSTSLPASGTPISSQVTKPKPVVKPVAKPVVKKRVLKYKKPSRTLKVGHRGTDVKNLQLQLTKKGYKVGKIDGKYGVKTKQAVAKFQKANKIKADGIANSKTLAKLF